LARKKKDGKYLNVMINSDVYARLAKYCEVVGQTKTIAVERALDSFIKEYDDKAEKLKRLEDMEIKSDNE